MPEAPPLKYDRFECSGTGFSFLTHDRASPSVIAVELGLKGLPSQKRIRSWWEAQVRLYGLDCSTWTLEEMKEVLKTKLQSGDLRVNDALATMEQVYIEKYVNHNACFQQRFKEAVEKRGTYTCLSRQEVCKVNDRYHRIRLLREIGRLGCVKGLPGLDAKQRLMFHREAERQGLFSKTSDDTLIIGKNRDDVMREVNRVTVEANDRYAAYVEEKSARRIKRQEEFDRMHREMVENGEDDDIGGMWIVKMGYSEEESTWHIASLDGSRYVWGSYGGGVFRVDLGNAGAFSKEEKTLCWTRTNSVDRYDFILENHKGEATVVFTSANTCQGQWHDQGFTGFRISSETSVTNKKCERECLKATVEIMAMDEKFTDMREAGYSKKERLKILYGSSDSDSN
jgi:hypothetical protein